MRCGGLRRAMRIWKSIGNGWRDGVGAVGRPKGSGNGVDSLVEHQTDRHVWVTSISSDGETDR